MRAKRPPPDKQWMYRALASIIPLGTMRNTLGRRVRTEALLQVILQAIFQALHRKEKP